MWWTWGESERFLLYITGRILRHRKRQSSGLRSQVKEKKKLNRNQQESPVPFLISFFSDYAAIPRRYIPVESLFILNFTFSLTKLWHFWRWNIKLLERNILEIMNSRNGCLDVLGLQNVSYFLYSWFLCWIPVQMHKWHRLREDREHKSICCTSGSSCKSRTSCQVENRKVPKWESGTALSKLSVC